jgi:fatty-acid peroxygenase
MPPMPSPWYPDSTLPLLSDPYRFISKTCRRLGSDVFQTRLLLQPTICMTGREATKLLYESPNFTRHKAAPRRLVATLFGRGGVQGLDGAAHRHRKALFMSLMTPERIEALVHETHQQWRLAVQRWSRRDSVTLYPAAQQVLTRAVCHWAGVPLPEGDVERRTQQLSLLFDAAGAIGPRHWAARQARQKTESWTCDVIEAYRLDARPKGDPSPAAVIARHRDLDGQALTSRVAAVELLNLLRPTIAISVYVVLMAHALHEHPTYGEAISSGDSTLVEPFVQEVRRVYPFFPAVAARVKEPFEWQGYRFPEGRRVLLDLYGTNHDPRHWGEPDVFRPERFAGRTIDAYSFIPQGGGDPNHHHRCAGEWITIALMKQAVEFLSREIDYRVPKQDLRIEFSRMPALPRSEFVMEGVRAKVS